LLTHCHSTRYPNELVLEGYEDAAVPVPALQQQPSQTDFFADWNVDPSIKAKPTTPVTASGVPMGPLRFAAPGAPAEVAFNSSSGGLATASVNGGSSVNTNNNMTNNYGKFVASQPNDGFTNGTQSGFNSKSLPVDVPVTVEVKPAERVSVTMAPVQMHTSNMSTTASGPTSSIGGFKKKGGAKKITKVIDFEEAARQAELEAERALQQKELEQSRNSKSASHYNNPYSSQPSPSSYNNSFNGNRQTEKKSLIPAAASTDPPIPEFKKFGFGFDPSTVAAETQAVTGVGHKQVASKPPQPSGFGATPTGFGSFPSANTSSDDSAVKKFGNAKAISSDMYFGRGQYDEAAK
jgi:hypothetical protein